MAEQVLLKVSKLNDYLKMVIDNDALLQNVRIEGELSNFKRHAASGHLYFSLKDEKAVINCVMFRSAADTLRFMPKNGQAVIAQGSVQVYPKTGQCQLYVRRMMPVGVGDLHAQYEKLREKLAAQGVFKSDFEKRPLPRMPKKIGVVTSPSGAVIRDIVRVLKRRWPMTEVLLVPAVVQGSEGAASICVSLAQLYERDDIDLIIAGRGGGSIEDLWCFNEEDVVRMIAASPVPIISAVGHETDVTLSDFAADVRAGTPSMAAELAVPDKDKLQAQLEQAQAMLTKNIQAQVQRKRERLKVYLTSVLMREPSQLLATYAMRLDQSTMGLEHAMQKTLDDKQKAFAQKVAALDALSPLAVLGRGYAFAEKDGQALSSVGQVKQGDTLTLHLNDGRVDAQVCEIYNEEMAK